MLFSSSIYVASNFLSLFPSPFKYIDAIGHFNWLRFKWNKDIYFCFLLTSIRAPGWAFLPILICAMSFLGRKYRMPGIMREFSLRAMLNCLDSFSTICNIVKIWFTYRLLIFHFEEILFREFLVIHHFLIASQQAASLSTVFQFSFEQKFQKRFHGFISAYHELSLSTMVMIRARIALASRWRGASQWFRHSLRIFSSLAW